MAINDLKSLFKNPSWRFGNVWEVLGNKNRCGGGERVQNSRRNKLWTIRHGTAHWYNGKKANHAMSRTFSEEPNHAIPYPHQGTRQTYQIL